jgi:hypothetical protein
VRVAEVDPDAEHQLGDAEGRQHRPDAEQPREHRREAGPGGEALRHAADRADRARAGAGRPDGPRLERLEHVAQRSHERLGGIRAVEERERFPPPGLVEVVARSVAEQVDRVGEVVVRREPLTALHRPRGHEQADEDQVDQRRSGPVEVVVVGGDELAELVDEEAEADAADDRGDLPDRAPEERQQQADRDQHEQPAPQQMRDVEPAAAQLRVVGQPQLGADHEDRRHAGDQQRLVERAEIRRARSRSQPGQERNRRGHT